MLLSRNKLHKTMAVIFILSFVFLTVLTIVIIYDHYHDAKSKYYLGSCINLLSVYESAQKEYHKANGKYASDIKTLSEYSEYLCLNGKEYFCDVSAEDDINNKCNNLSLTITDEGNYRIEARTKDRTNCYLCITPEGINRWHFRECTDGDKNYYP